MISALQKKNIFLIIGVLFLSVSGVFQMSTGGTHAIHGNDVIDGGVSSEEQLQNIVVDDSSNPHAHHIFNEAFGGYTTPEDMTGMVSGTLHRDGTVTVDGKTVATDAHTSGRESFTEHDQVLARDANGKPVAYHAPVPHRFATDAASPAVFVKLDENGQYQHAVLKNCGNPVLAEPVPVEEPEPEPEVAFECKDLQADDTHGRAPMTVDFTASANVENTEVEGYEFDYGDGSDEQLFATSDTELTVSHTYDEAGSFTASVNVITEDGNTGFHESQCQVDVEVEEKKEEKPEPEPEVAFKCEDLSADDTRGKEKLTTTFTADADAQHTDITGYEWDFDGDGDVDETTQDNQVTYTYTEPGEYTARVNVVTEDGETGFTNQCEVDIKVKEKEKEPEEEPKPEPEKEELEQEQEQQQQQQQQQNVDVDVDQNVNIEQADHEEEQEQEQTQTQRVAEEQPDKLANTGIGSAAMGLMGSASLGVGIRGWWRSRRGLMKSLLDK